jgi:hypothetical protein
MKMEKELIKEKECRELLNRLSYLNRQKKIKKRSTFQRSSQLSRQMAR